MSTISEPIDLLSPESAVVRGRWRVVTKKVEADGLFTLVMKKLPEGWRIVQVHMSVGVANESVLQPS